MASSIGSAFTAGGGITGPQRALANYTTAEQMVGNAGAWAGAPMSTMKTQADTGALAAGALQASQMSQADAAAEAQFINNQFNQFAGGLGSLLGGIGGKTR
jgi:hypothetical protein